MILKESVQVEASQELLHDLGQAVGEVKADRMTRLLFSTDASIYQQMPLAVAAPRDADEVCAAVEVARKHHVPILARGNGSSLDGQATGTGIILDMTKYMDQLVEVNPEEGYVRAQPGLILGRLNKLIGKTGLMFGPDPASADRATVGGICGNNSTGAHSIVYGMTADHVESLNVILSDTSRIVMDPMNGDGWIERGKRPGLEGEIYRSVEGILSRYADEIATRYPKTWRTVAGYNLNNIVRDDTNIARLMIGSESTLGIFTEAKLKLVPIPKKRRLVLVHFSALRAALEAVPVMLESGPSAIELIDEMMLNQTRDRVEYRRLLTFIEGEPVVVLIVEYSGETDAELDAGVDRLRRLLAKLGHKDPAVVVADPVGQANVWYVRKVGLGLLMSIKGDAKPLPFIEDVAVPVQHLADYVMNVLDIVQRAGLERVGIYAHASAGCLHLRPVINLKTAEGIRQMREIGEGVVDLVMKYGGSISGEHGEGLARGEFSERYFGPKMVKAFHELKAAFDPECIMNPGKMVDVPRMDDQTILRFGADYATPISPASTALDFTVDGGYARAVEMCNGAGVCRKIDGGVMCPSFMATRDEEHSTRGRANALRSAMMGYMGPKGTTSPEVYAVMDLCLSCKGCKAECPSMVDLAKIKLEFLYQYYKEHGLPLRNRLIGNFSALNKLGQPFAPITNVMMRGPIKWFMTAVGIHPKRHMPLLAVQSFSAWFKRHNLTPRPPLRLQRGGVEEQKRVILFNDTFMEHNHPEIGQAAVKVLEAAGYEVIVLKHECCGRTALSKGLLDEARRMAQKNVALFAPYARQGIPIVGCEPSCMAAFVDEYLDLVPGEDTKAVAAAVTLLDDFIAREAEAGRLKLHFDETPGETPREIVLHGHCHQKALFSTRGTNAMLKLIPNCTVKEIDSTCCGMAGSFGYEQEHYDLSIQIAEISVAPAVRAAPESALVAAPGTSCREQIYDTTGRSAKHPIQILAEALNGKR